ncbi:MAG: DUF559 domain-containing protein, partial [Marinirhabdus sp.]
GKIKSNRDFWIPKIERNMQKDAEVNAALEAMGYTVFRFWEREVKHDMQRCIKDVINHIVSYPFPG